MYFYFCCTIASTFTDIIYIQSFFFTWVLVPFHNLLMVRQLPQTNPGFNNTPFKFTKYSNAYMLVYIRESDKDKIICNVDEKDIAEHLRVRSRFNCKVVGYFMILSRHLIHSILILWSNSNEPLTEADCMYYGFEIKFPCRYRKFLLEHGTRNKMRYK